MIKQEPEDIFSEYTATIWGNSTPPPLLYHYTSIEGARSIISNGKALWASSFETMNDNKELRHGFTLAKNEVPLLLAGIFTDQSFVTELSNNWTSFLQNDGLNPMMRPYILSFTESSESVLHWQEYADSSKGIALEFKHNFNLNNSAGGYWVKVVYDEAAARENLRARLRAVTELFKKFYTGDPKITEDSARKQLGNLLHAYLQIVFDFSISLKEPKWAGEQEWRLILFKSPSKQELSPHGEIQYRTRKSELVDYLVVDTKICGYELSRVKTGYYFPANSLNGLSHFVTQSSLVLIE